MDCIPSGLQWQTLCCRQGKGVPGPGHLWNFLQGYHWEATQGLLSQSHGDPQSSWVMQSWADQSHPGCHSPSVSANIWWSMGEVAPQGPGDGPSCCLPWKGAMLPDPQWRTPLGLWKCSLMVRAVDHMPWLNEPSHTPADLTSDLGSSQFLMFKSDFIPISSFYTHMGPNSQKPSSLLSFSLSLPEDNCHCYWFTMNLSRDTLMIDQCTNVDITAYRSFFSRTVHLGDLSLWVHKEIPRSFLQLPNIPAHFCPIIYLTHPQWMDILSYFQSFGNTNLVPLILQTWKYIYRKNN